jgi:peroxiredoxin
MNSSSNEASLLANTTTSNGETLAALSERSPVLLVLLRHEGCPFCRNAMSDIARLRPRIEDVGTRVVLGHMWADTDFAAFATRYGLSSLATVADPGRTLYKGLGLKRGSLIQLMSPRVLWASFRTTMAGHLPGKVKGDLFQLPGAFLLHHGQVVKSHEYQDASDRPDYVSLATPAS